MKKITIILCFLSSVCFAQLSNLPSSVSTNITAFKYNALNIPIQFEAGYALPGSISAEIWEINGTDGQKVASIIPAIEVSGQMVTVKLTKTQVGKLKKNSAFFLILGSDYKLGAKITTTVSLGVPSISPIQVALPDIGIVKINLVGDPAQAQAYSAIASAASNTAVTKSAEAVAAAATATAAATTAQAQYELKGSYDVSTNTPTLSADATIGQTNPSKPQKYIIPKKGALAFAIVGHAIADSIGTGELIQHPSGQWFFNPTSIADKSIVTSTIADKAVIPAKTSFFSFGKNLVDKSTVIENYGLTNAYAIVSSTNNSLFRVEVQPNTAYTYYVSTQYPSSVKIRFEDSNKGLLSGKNANGVDFSELPYTFTTPATCRYVVLNARTSAVTGAENTAQLEVGSNRTQYEAYNLKVPIDQVRGTFALVDTVGKNLCDPATKIENFGITDAYALVNSVNNGIYRIPVKPNTTYTYYMVTQYPGSVKMRFEASDGSLISGYNAGAANFTSLPATFTTPAGCSFVVVNSRTGTNVGDGALAQMEIGTFKTMYEPFNNKVSISKVDYTPVLTKSVFLPWKGKKVCFFGNSIVFNNYFQPLIQQMHEFIYVNDAVSGSCIATGKETAEGDGITRVALVTRASAVNATNSDLIMVMAGTNDWFYNVPVGSVTDTGTTTFYGAVKALIVSLQANNVGKRIAFATPIQRTNSRSNYASQKQYADAIKEVCAMYSVPVLDLFYGSGITYENISQFTSDNVHPSQSTGAPYMARLISAFFFRL